jgi:hypothetical protein
MVSFLKLKIMLLSFAFVIIVSCEIFRINDNNCAEEYFNNKIQFGKYYSEKYYSNDSSRYTFFQFSFYEDSTFSYLRIWHQNGVDDASMIDTVTILNGKFIVYKDFDLPWYILDLNADFIYEKEIEDSLGGILHFTAFNSNKFNGFENKFFTNTDSNGHHRKNDIGNVDMDRCFSLNAKYSNSDNYCGYYKKEENHSGCYWYLYNTRIFCLEQPEEETQSNSTGDNL